jgi:hypothetical protein
MFAPCLVVALVSCLLAWFASALWVPSRLVGQFLGPDLPFFIAVGGSLLSLAALVVNGLRLHQWQKGKGIDCFVCGCLLGRERSGRWGSYRKCMGCGRNHSLVRLSR